MTTERKKYTTPQLTVHGDVNTLTQGQQGDGCGPSSKGCYSGDGNSRLSQPGLS